MNLSLYPEQASAAASQVDGLYWFLVALCLLVLAAVFLPIIYFLFKYRRSRDVDRTLPQTVSWKIEAGWTLVTLLVFLGIFFWAAIVYFDMRSPPREARDIHVIGKQWMWKAHHAAGNREINTLHVPVGEDIRLVMTSQDVIHSFFIPAFRIKQDVLPNRYTTLWFHAKQPGRYHLFCAEYCGSKHSRMRGQVVVMEPKDFQQWLDRPQATPMAREGERLFRRHGCSGCHAAGTSTEAPNLEGLYNRPVPLQDGRVVTADLQYLRDSILFPNREIVAGYDPIMPSFDGILDEAELFKIIAYIRSLEAPDTEEEPR